jgi:pimeloyl-ACP methyl ester carboxylesterase
MGTLGTAESATAWLDLHANMPGADERVTKHCLPLMAVRQPDADVVAVRAGQIRTPEVNDHFSDRFNDLDLTQDAERVSCPTTVVIGARDPLTSPELGQSTVTALAGPARLVVVPDAAHDLLVDAPEVVLESIRNSRDRLPIQPAHAVDDARAHRTYRRDGEGHSRGQS